MDFIARLVLKYSLPIIVVTLIVTIFFAYHAAQIEIKPGLKDMLPETSEVRQTFDEVAATFGGVSYVVVALEDENVLDAATLRKVREMTATFAQIDGVEGVTSLTNVSSIQSDLLGIQVRPLVEAIPETEAQIRQLKEKLLQEEQYLGAVVSEDFTATTLLVKIRHDLASPEDVARAVQEMAVGFAEPEQVYVTGSIVMANEAADYMERDLARLFPFVTIVILLILWLSFRNLQGIFLPLITVLISVVWSVGMVSLLGKSLSLVSIILPVLLVSVGSAYAIHIMTRYYEELAEGLERREAVRNTLNKVGIAVVMAGGTTIAGFGSLFFSNLVIIKDFALATSLGVGFALVISILFIPALFLHLSPGQGARGMERSIFSTRFFQLVNQVMLKGQSWVLGVVLVLIIGSVVVIPGLKPDTNYNNYFKRTSPPRQATELVSEKFGGSYSLEVVIHGNIKDPDLLGRMEDFQDEAEQLPGLSKSLSMVTIFREEDQALHGVTEGQIPTTAREIAQYLLLLTMSGQGLLDDLLTFDQNTNRMQFRMSIFESKQTAALIQQMNELIEKHFGAEYQVQMTGAPILTDALTQMVVSSQVKSLIGSILFTFLITSIFLKSWRRGMICSLPIALTVLVNFGVMGWLGISLDIATAMIASIAVGIGVDYSIHVFTRYLEELEKNDGTLAGSEAEVKGALQTAIFTVGRANLYNALTVIAGFGVILFSSFPPLVHFGGLTAITMGLSFFGAVLLLPTAILLARKGRIQVEFWWKERIAKDQNT